MSAPTPAPDRCGVPAGERPKARGAVRESLLAVLAPFLVSRALLVLLAWSSRMFPPRTDFVRRTWWLVPTYLLDVWGRWDTEWYLRIALEGYGHAPPSGMSKLAFYPLFPALVAAGHALVPAALRGTAAALVVGIAIANACAIAALALLHLDVRERDGAAAADRAIFLLLAFPSAFVLSCAYTESLFLLLTVAALHLARRGRWAGAGVACALATLTRPTGMFVAPVLLLVAWERRRDGRHLRALLAAALAPAAWLAYQVWCWQQTGEWLATVHAQAAWNRNLTWPWNTLFFPHGGNFATDVDVFLVLGAIALGGWAVLKARWRVDGAFVLAVVASFVFTGVLFSASRFLIAAFPMFVVLAHLARRRRVERAYVAIMLPIQALYWIAWARMYRVF